VVKSRWVYLPLIRCNVLDYIFSVKEARGVFRISNYKGREFFLNFWRPFYPSLSVSKRAKVHGGPKSSTVLSKHHRMPLVRMFQTYSTCVLSSIGGARRFASPEYAPGMLEFVSRVQSRSTLVFCWSPKHHV